MWIEIKCVFHVKFFGFSKILCAYWLNSVNYGDALNTGSAQLAAVSFSNVYFQRKILFKCQFFIQNYDSDIITISVCKPKIKYESFWFEICSRSKFHFYSSSKVVNNYSLVRCFTSRNIHYFVHFFCRLLVTNEKVNLMSVIRF